METKKLQVEWQGKKAEVEIKRFTYGERNDIQEKAIDTNLVGGAIRMNISLKTMREEALAQGIVSAPFEVDINTIRDLPADIGDKIYAEIESYNNLNPEKKGDSDGRSGTEAPTEK